ncbi:MAG: glutamate racemase [Oscillospiraceae bacterium]|nr:glutamate racemase [Oscillospiraceae bacterium]
MKDNMRPIGVLDSGVGGLTVVRRLQAQLPGEDILYFGDSANVPYGNRSEDEIFALTMKMIHFLAQRDVKCIAIACNTISTIVKRLRAVEPCPLLSIVEAGASYVVREKLPRVGLIATEFTVSKGAYDARIHAHAPRCEVVSKGSPSLAALIDGGCFGGAAVETEIRTQVDNILSRAPVEHLLLACTHFPIVEDSFRACYPQLKLIDPAEQQAKAVDLLLTERGWHNEQPRGTLSIYTTGDPALYADVAGRLGLAAPAVCAHEALA